MPGGITVAHDQDYAGIAAGEALLPLRGQHSLARAARRCFPFHRLPGCFPMGRNRWPCQC